MINKKRILFYSSVSSTSLFYITGFYVMDIKALKLSGFEVEITNKFSSFLRFWNYDISLLYFYKKSLIPALISKLLRKKIFFTGGIDELSDFNESAIAKKKYLNTCFYLIIYFQTGVILFHPKITKT